MIKSSTMATQDVMARRASEFLPGTGRGTARRRRGVEGLALRQNITQRPVEIMKDFARGDPERAIALRHQPFVAGLVTRGVAAAVVRFSSSLAVSPA